MPATSASGESRTKCAGQSMSALPGWFRRRLVLLGEGIIDLDSEVPDTLDLQLGPDRPNVLWPERRLRGARRRSRRTARSLGTIWVTITEMSGAQSQYRTLICSIIGLRLTPTRLLRLSKNLPHDWKEQRRFLGFAA
jgi:hypothetical protein